MSPELRKYDAIRPFEPEELPEVYQRLLGNQQFVNVAVSLFPGMNAELLAQKMYACTTNLDFQKTFCYGFLKNLMAKASRGFDLDATAVDTSQRYTFVSNHRDIVLDSALLDVLLVDAGFQTTCEIAIGDNLLSLPWVKDLVRINKSFIVQRSLTPREMLAASKLMAEYMHYVIAEKNDNLWIAQREGRAKDSDDRTQPAILKMMAMGGSGTPIERIQQLNIVPLAISYEYDPCDYLKAREFQFKRDVPGWKKTAADDIESMRTGIMGYKGRVHYHAAPCINPWLQETAAGIPKSDLFNTIAQYIDSEIHRRYQLFPSNFVALDLLEGSARHADRYTNEDHERFEGYLQKQLAKIEGLPNRDDDFLRECMLTMYANPARNHLVYSEE